MKKFRKLVVLLLSAGMIMAFTACGSNDKSAPDKQAESGTSSPSDSSESFTFDNVGFSYELPEDLNIEKGSVDKFDFGEITYGSGVMMGYPVYYNMTEEELSTLPEDEAGEIKSGGTFVIICVKDAENLEQAKERFLQAMADFMGQPLSQEEIDEFSAVKEIHNENGCMWLMAKRDRMTLDEVFSSFLLKSGKASKTMPSSALKPRILTGTL